jgi:hypothetical protein
MVSMINNVVLRLLFQRTPVILCFVGQILIGVTQDEDPVPTKTTV